MRPAPASDLLVKALRRYRRYTQCRVPLLLFTNVSADEFRALSANAIRPLEPARMGMGRNPPPSPRHWRG